VLANHISWRQLGALLALDVDHHKDGQDQQEGHHRNAAHNRHQQGDALCEGKQGKRGRVG